MMLCITAKGSTMDAPVEERFGRSPYLILIDTDTGTETSIQNPGADAAGGVGPRTVQLLVNHGVKAVVTGQVGGNAASALQAAGIDAYQYRAGGTVRDALALYRAGKLTRLL